MEAENAQCVCRASACGRKVGERREQLCTGGASLVTNRGRGDTHTAQKRARWRGLPARVSGRAPLQRAQVFGDDMLLIQAHWLRVSTGQGRPGAVRQ